MRIRKGDKVQVLNGKDRGKQAEVIRAIPSEGRVIVEGVHVAKRHAKPTRATMQGGVIDKFMPVAVSSVAIVCGSCGPTRIGTRIDEHFQPYPGVEFDDATAHSVDERFVVRGHDDRRARAVDAFEQRHDRLGVRRVEVAGRFVGQED